jgi:hypothetical protein
VSLVGVGSSIFTRVVGSGGKEDWRSPFSNWVGIQECNGPLLVAVIVAPYGQFISFGLS